MIIRGGMNIAAAAVEAVISEGTSIDVSCLAFHRELILTAILESNHWHPRRGSR